MSRGGIPVSDSERRRRLALARGVVAAGGTATAFAKNAGLTSAAAANWLVDNAPDLHAQLTAMGRGRPLSGHSALVRLLLIKSVEGIRGGHKRLAIALGLTPNALSAFKNQWAPDGLDAAIADLMPNDANGNCALNHNLKGSFPTPVHEVAHG